MEESNEPVKIVKLPHHEEEPLCETRAKYRQGKKLTAVKVYTVADESRHLLLRNVTSLDIADELAALCQRFGPLAQFGPVEGYETERFTKVYHVQYKRMAAARFAKVQLDDRSFFGTHLKACYAPELETLEETADKLRWRRLYYRNGLARGRGGRRPGERTAAVPPAQADPGPSGDPPPAAEPPGPLIGPCLPLPGEWVPHAADGGAQQTAPPEQPEPPTAPDRPRKRIVFKRKSFVHSRIHETPEQQPNQPAETSSSSSSAEQSLIERTTDRLRMVREQIQQAVLHSIEKRRRCDEDPGDA
ncbi:RNA-binding protein 48-like isoform X2 [Amphibalanus amphitrite]|uniref:RNA-binding protein 48-like isoform X2 n=1 Tax=Amphibalanus amphitrite TaxID=1232801 RepID=UPI001C90B4B1|nr:RNA-binding protein 48-like isoform X2 [Amphibalanus amphitrite]XP_043215558.1 RNA-binding protein 48-like isoform X2 [Amphibalanus amphitrite]